jgi:hypothetical protein
VVNAVWVGEFVINPGMKSHFWTSEKRQVFDDIYREFDIRVTDSKISAEYPDSQKFTGMLTASSQEFTGTYMDAPQRSRKHSCFLKIN